MADNGLTAVALKGALWETLKELRTGKVDPAVADSVAVQAREITRVARLQLQIVKQSKTEVPAELIQFASPRS